MLTLTLREQPSVQLETEVISPDTTASLDHAAIRALPVLLGKRRHRLDDFFEVDGEGSEEIVIRGDCAKVKMIGHRMTRGSQCGEVRNGCAGDEARGRTRGKTEKLDQPARGGLLQVRNARRDRIERGILIPRGGEPARGECSRQ